jgi:hypothetical protein
MDANISKDDKKWPALNPLLYIIKWSNFPLIILLIGALLRTVGYSSSAIRYDEAISLYRATTPFSQYLVDLQRYSSLFHWEFILRLVSVFGTDLWIIRLPSVVTGIITLLLVWKLMEKLNYSKTQRYFVSIVIAFCPGLLWISQDARAYGLIVFLYLLSILFILERKWLGLFATNGLLIYTHIIGPAFAVGSFIYAIVSYPKEWKRFILLGFAVIATWIPWGILYLNLKSTPQFSDTFWLGKLSFGGFFWQLISAFFVRMIDYPFVVFFIITIVFSIILLIKHSLREPDNNILIFLSPFLVIFSVSLLLENVLFFRTQISLIVPFAISIGSAIPGRQGKILEWMMIGMWVITIGIGIFGWNPRLRGGDVDKVAKMIKDNWRDGDIMYYATGTTALPFDYYLSGKPAYLLDGATNSNLTPPTLRGFEYKSLEKIQHQRGWIVFPLDVMIPSDQMNRLFDYVKDGELIQTIHIFEIPDIQVYLVDSKTK